MSVLRTAAAHVLVRDVGSPALSDDQAHHVFRVLRVRDGAVVTVTDGRGRWRACRATGTDLEPTDEPTLVGRRPCPLTVGFAIPKQDRPEWIVQKLTEIGIDRIVVLHAERSVVRWSPDRATRHVAKLHRVAAEALQQSRGVWLPEIDGPLPALAFLASAAAAEPGARPISVGDATIAIGPEGGWTSEELSRSVDTVSIGSTVLRVETAAIVAASRIVMHAE
ncbi:MAG: RsmE family RNA methyltransferase [Ilumatobacteraceae bacterium]